MVKPTAVYRMSGVRFSYAPPKFMSTKCTIKYGNDFHFYNECFDEDNVYLRLDKADIEQYGETVTMIIPKAIWAIIRESAEVNLEYALMTDEQILEYVTNEVDSRIARHNAETKEGLRQLHLLAGSFTFGFADEARDKQIKKGVKSYTEIRKREKKILNRINKYKRENKR